MSVLELLSHPATIIVRTPDPANADEYGNPGSIETEFPTLAEIQQESATETNSDAVETTTWRVFLPPDAPTRGWNALQIEDGSIEGGSRFELEGDAWQVRNPRTGLISHVEARVRRVE